MKHYTALIFRSLRGQPKRSLLTMMSIFLAVSLMSTVSTLAASIQQTKVNQAIALTGNFHGSYNHLSSTQVDELKNDRSSAVVGTSVPLGSFTRDSISMSIEGFDTNALDLFNFQLIDGRFPQKEGEIVLEAWVVEHLDTNLSIGDSIHLPYFLYKHSEFGQATESTPIEVDFTLIGIIEDIPAAKMTGISLGLVSQETVSAQHPAESIPYTAFVRVQDGEVIRAALERLKQDLGIDNDLFSVNESVVRALESGNEARTPILLLASLIVVASIATIFNIFQISVVERIRQFGILRSIGATSAQILVLIMGEALLLCLAAIPFGLMFGIGAAALLGKTLNLLKSSISALSIPVWALAVSAFTGLISTLVSALLPAVSASKISPMAAIRSADTNEKVKFTQRKSSSSPGKSRLISQMAYYNLWRNRVRSLVTIFSLGLGVVLFILLGAYASGMDAGSVAERFLRGDYAIYSSNFMSGSGFSQETANEIENLPGVSKIIKTYEDDMNFSLVPDIESQDERYQHIKRQAEKNNSSSVELAEDGYIPVPSMVFGYDDEILSSLVDKIVEGSIDSEQISNGFYAVIVDPDGFFNLHPGDELKLKKVIRENEGPSVQELSFKIAAVISEPPVFLGYGLLGPQVILSDEAFQAYTGYSEYKRFDVTVEKNADRELIEGHLRKVADSIEQGTFTSFEQIRGNLEKEKREILMMVYVLVSIVTLIGVVNIINTLTTSLIVRTREFGTLRAVGMTGDQLKKMTRMEGFYYGLFSSGWGTVIGTILAFLLLQISSNEGPVGWTGLPLQGILLAAAGSILVSVLATISPIRRIAELTIIDSLRGVE